MLTTAQWEAIKADRIADTAGRCSELPVAYRDWVIREGQRRGLPTLRVGADLGIGEVQNYDALIGKCEREIERRNPTPRSSGDRS